MTENAVLVVEDSLDNQKLIQLLLEFEGYDVHLAEDAPQALAELQRCHPRLILMDIQLPGIDGIQLTRQLRQDPAFDDVLIVALTAYASKADEEHALQAGCDGYITKPIDTRAFPAQVDELLQRDHVGTK